MGWSDQLVEVVGESHYQEAIRTACNWVAGVDTLFECFAELVLEPTNPHDSAAIMVRIEGSCVGYLSRCHAKQLGGEISARIARQGTGLCRAVIAGHAVGDTENLGVFLHLPPRPALSSDL
jgi:hypothetical protein